MHTRDWSIQEIARLTGTTSRTLRHYDAEQDETSALETHLVHLREEQDSLTRRIASVESTLHALREGEPIMAEKMFDGFDHTRYREEVEQRWGDKAYADGDRWWRSLSDAERGEWKRRLESLNRDWITAAGSGVDPASDDAQALAQRHVDWLSGVPGTPPASREYVLGLGEMYVADERFAANYGGVAGAGFVRDALRVYAERNLRPGGAEA